MKRLHVSFSVADLDKSVAFYSTLFDGPPTVKKDDYAKWMLDDPRVNFVVTTGGETLGFAHAGIQVDAADELPSLFDRLKAAEAPYLPEGETICCYHKSEKSWTADPDGVMWEVFYTHHQTEEFGSEPDVEALEVAAAKERPRAPGRCC